MNVKSNGLLWFITAATATLTGIGEIWTSGWLRIAIVTVDALIYSAGLEFATIPITLPSLGWTVINLLVLVVASGFKYKERLDLVSFTLLIVAGLCIIIVSLRMK